MKGALQTLLQRLGLPLPDYSCLPHKGPAHNPTFTVKLEIKSNTGQVLWGGHGSGKTKKEAESAAAQYGLECVKSRLEDGTLYSSATAKACF